ncbi:PREDICTED: uncharacterized protein LOC109344647 [Lupinus angustifolius]|uniref:uncharacterized protein LOC109344647 n=1 Tax=Lupinus angustifolius TaxID=3871 RepID=UPI00092E9034|nr:PREDICTED: uncharacterized protein LOC109344647 [Lupinus angustifolius]
MGVDSSPTNIFLCQHKYALNIISKAGLLGTKPAGTPLEQNHHLPFVVGSLFDNSERYRRLEPRTMHWNVALHVVRFLKGNPGQGILLSNHCNLRLHGWCNSDWDGCPLTHQSVTGWLVQFGQSHIS